MRQRETRFVSDLRGAAGRPIVLVGAGGLGQRIGDYLTRSGAIVAAFADNNPARQGTSLFDVPVLSVREAARRFAPNALFVVTIWNSGHSFKTTHSQLVSLGCTAIAPWVHVAWAAGDALLPQYAAGLPSSVIAQRELVLGQAGVWADLKSAEVYANQVAWRLNGEFAELNDPEGDQYFPMDIVEINSGEVLVDCGAYDGDTISEFLARAPDFAAVHAFEPDAESFAALERTALGFEEGVRSRLRLYPFATGESAGVAAFLGGEGASGRVINDGLGTAGPTRTEVLVAGLDETLSSEPVTFIKMDVEGAERATLLGAVNLIRDRRPLLAVSAYHMQSDLWELPHLIRSLTEDYLLYLRSHRPDSFDCVVYGIPIERKA